jgi:hypothetical protein
MKTERITAAEYRALMAAPARNKYNAKRVKYDGIWFDSIKESQRYAELRLLERAGVVKDIAVHPVYMLSMSDTAICNYIPDFRYTDVKTGDVVVEDVKGRKATQTTAWRLKWKMAKAQYPDVRWEVVE